MPLFDSIKNAIFGQANTTPAPDAPAATLAAPAAQPLNIEAALTRLAQELVYIGDAPDSAGMNVWLHKQVMAELGQNGGKLPASPHR